jgi:hypothetical protein
VSSSKNRFSKFSFITVCVLAALFGVNAWRAQENSFDSLSALFALGSLAGLIAIFSTTDFDYD